MDDGWVRCLPSVRRLGGACVLVGLLACWGVTGCELVTDDQARQTVLAEDPAFEAVLQRKAEVDAAIQAERDRLAGQRRDIDRRIDALKAEYDAAKTRTDGLIAGLIARLDPERRQAELGVHTAEQSLQAKRAEQQSLQRTVQLLERSLEQDPEAQAGDQAASDDRSNRLAAARGQLETVAREIESLRHAVTICKYKQRLLRQRR